MALAIGDEVFRRKLKSTDLKHKLNWPAQYLGELPDFNGRHTVDFTVKDASGTIRNFKCCKRITGLYDKPVVTTGWIPFLKSKRVELKEGDEVVFYRSLDPQALFEIRIKRNTIVFGFNLHLDIEI